MASPGIDIDEIVRRVLLAVGGEPAKEGTALEGSVAAQKCGPVDKGAVLKHASGVPGDALILDSPVVTLEQLRGWTGAVRHLFVPPGTLITPAARDRLRELKIKVSMAAESLSPAGHATLIIGLADTRFNPGPLENMLQGKGIVAEHIGATEMVATVREIAQRVTGGKQHGVLLTDNPHVALCLANRHAGVRAVQASDASALRQAVKSVGANVLVMTTQGKSTHQLARLIQQSVVAGPRCCPDEYRAHLEGNNKSGDSR